MVMAVEGLKSRSEGTEWQSNHRDSLIANLPPKLQPLLDQFDAALSDDLMVPRALPLIEEALSMKKVAVEDKLRLTAAMDMALGLNLMTITRADLRVRPKDASIIADDIESQLDRPQPAPAKNDLPPSAPHPQ